MLGRWPSLPARMSSSFGRLTKWDTGTGGLMLLWMRPARNAGPLTRPRRPRRPRLAVVRWLLLDSRALWCYTECSSLCFCILVCFVALGPAADAVERRKNPSPVLSPGGGFSCVWGSRWAVGQGPTVGLAPIGSSGWRSYVKARCKRPRRGLALASDRRSDTPPQRAYLCAPAARNAGKGPACGALAGGVQIAAPRRGKGCSSSPQPGPRLGWGAAPPARGPGPLRPPEGRGRRGGRPHSPHRVGAGPPRSTCAAPGTGEEQCKAGPSARPAGAWPCIAEGCPRATAAAQLDRAGLARPWAAHYPGQPPQGDGRGGRRHAAQGGQGCGPLAAGGGWDGPEGRTGAPTTARRRWPPSRCPQQLPAMGAGCGE